MIKDSFQKLYGKKLHYSEYEENEDFWIHSENIHTAHWRLNNDDGLTITELEYIRNLPDR